VIDHSLRISVFCTVNKVVQRAGDYSVSYAPFLPAQMPCDWIWAIAAVGTACWMKLAGDVGAKGEHGGEGSAPSTRTARSDF